MTNCSVSCDHNLIKHFFLVCSQKFHFTNLSMLDLIDFNSLTDCRNMPLMQHLCVKRVRKKSHYGLDEMKRKKITVIWKLCSQNCPRKKKHYKKCWINFKISRHLDIISTSTPWWRMKFQHRQRKLPPTISLRRNLRIFN